MVDVDVFVIVLYQTVPVESLVLLMASYGRAITKGYSATGDRMVNTGCRRNHICSPGVERVTVTTLSYMLVIPSTFVVNSVIHDTSKGSGSCRLRSAVAEHFDSNKKR